MTGGGLRSVRGGGQELRRGLQAGQRRGGPSFRLLAGALDQAVIGAEQVREPEGRVVDVGAFVLEAEDVDPDVVEEGGAVDFVLQVGDLQLLDRARHGAVGGELPSHADVVEGAEPGVGVRVSRRGAGRRVEVPAEVEVRPRQRVSDGWHRPRSAPGPPR